MTTKQRVQQLIDYVHAGRMLEAIEEFYADDVVMQENLAAPTVGHAANLERERAFYGSVDLHQLRAQSFVVDGDRATINWLLEFTGTDGKRYRIDEMATQTWRGDKIVHERFIYDTASMLAAA